jgi:hypothetical protein
MISPARLLLCTTAMVVAGCGSASASGGAAGSASPSAAARGAGGGTAGQLVQVNGNLLTLSTSSGDASVAYSGATSITATSTGSAGDIVAGSCVVIVGQKDSTGAVTASSVRLSKALNGSCATRLRPGGGIGAAGGSPGAFPSGSPRPSRSGAPTLNPNAAFVTGLVTAVTGTTVTVKGATGTASSVTVPTTLSVTESSAATAADLTVDSCVRAIGAKNSGGVVQATALTIQPTDATGSCTFSRAGGLGGFGGFGGRPGAGGSPPTNG